MALAAAVDRPHHIDQQLREFPVVASAVIYRGAALSVRSSGYVGPLAAGEQFAGFAYESVTGTGTNGEKKVQAYVQGDFEVPLASAAVTDLGDALYASDDGTFTKTSASNTYVGVIVGYVSSTTVIVRINDAFGRTAAP
jgi:predicted RecA/RadA family phage recombinase